MYNSLGKQTYKKTIACIMLCVNCTSILNNEIKQWLQYDVTGSIVPIAAVHRERYAITEQGVLTGMKLRKGNNEGFTKEVTSEVMVKPHGKNRKCLSVTASQWRRKQEAGWTDSA